jgi:hypothetical protein
MNIWPFSRITALQSELRDACVDRDAAQFNVVKYQEKLIEANNFLFEANNFLFEARDALNEESIARQKAQYELAQIKVKRSDVTRRGNITKAEKLKVLRNETRRKLAAENAQRQAYSEDINTHGFGCLRGQGIII